MSKHIVATAVILLAILLAACSGGEDPQTAFCTDLKTVNDVVAASALTGQATNINQIIAVQTNLINSWSDMMKTAEKLEDPEVMAVLEPAAAAMDAIPVSTQETARPVALESVSRQAQIASEATAQVAHVCLGGG